MALYMESTEVPVSRSIAEITQALVESGANGIYQEYANQKVVAISFTIVANGQEIPFRLPARVEPVYRLLHKQRRRWVRGAEQRDREQAERVAWRQILRWVQAQLALIQTGMAQTVEVFMPYIRMTSGQTWFEQLEATKFKALPAPEKQ